MTDEPTPKTRTEWRALCWKQINAASARGWDDIADLFWAIAREWKLID